MNVRRHIRVNDMLGWSRLRRSVGGGWKEHEGRARLKLLAYYDGSRVLPCRHDGWWWGVLGKVFVENFSRRMDSVCVSRLSGISPEKDRASTDGVGTDEFVMLTPRSA